jgi:hypothetical protein
MVWRVTPTWAASCACDHSRSARSTRRRVLNKRMRSPLVNRAENLGPTWGQNQGLLGPNLGFSGGKGNRLNRTFGRGGGDRTQRRSPKAIEGTCFAHAATSIWNCVRGLLCTSLARESNWLGTQLTHGRWSARLNQSKSSDTSAGGAGQFRASSKI